MNTLNLLFSLLAFCAPVFASSGDRLPEYQDCVAQCDANTCPRDMGALKLLLWTCEQDCKYICQQSLTDVFERNGWGLHQFHGKWPFRRYFGLQEIASVVFSMMNFLPNLWGYFYLKKIPGTDGLSLKKYYLAFAVVGMNTWLWSSVFHTRDFWTTEKLDYFSAIGQIMFGMFLALLRLFRLDHSSMRLRRQLVIGVLASYYAGHIFYLSFIRFHYGYNMLAGVVIGLAQTLLWIYLGLRLYARTKDKMDLLPVFLVLSVILGMSFELNDFSPYWRLVDAHSLWHLSTVLPTFLWYKWLAFDLKRQAKQALARKEQGRPSW